MVMGVAQFHTLHTIERKEAITTVNSLQVSVSKVQKWIFLMDDHNMNITILNFLFFCCVIVSLS